MTSESALNETKKSSQPSTISGAPCPTTEGDKPLTREYGLAHNITPTGRKLGIVAVVGTGSCRIKFVDSKPGDLPEELSGLFTGFPFAQKTLNKYLNRFWDTSDKATKK
jgi:hypothetical protein